jgi:hypothetical protein
MATERIIDDETIARMAEAALGDLEPAVRDFVRGFGHRRFAPDASQASREAAEAAVREYLATGDRAAAAAVLEAARDPLDQWTEIARAIKGSDFMAWLAAEVETRMPEAMADRARMREMVDRTCLLAVAERVQRADASVPFDMVEDQTVILCHVPGSAGVHDFEAMSTTHWSDRSDPLTIRPDERFIGFLKLLGVSKGDWQEAVAGGVTLARLSSTAHILPERNKAWDALAEWETDGRRAADPAELAAAVSACPSGFTPMIAFSIDAAAALSLAFDETIEVTGGVVCLHDFKNGTGDVMRFETTVSFKPEFGEIMIVPDDPLGFVAIHGLVERSFASRVEIVAPVPDAAPARTFR